MQRKRKPKSVIRDQVCLPTTGTVDPGHASDQDYAPANASPRVCYVPNQLPCEGPAEIPRFFVQGARGSIQLDLGGLGIELHPHSFCHLVPDEAFEQQGIRKGDLAIIEPSNRGIEAGTILLALNYGREKLMQAVERNGLMFLRSDGGQHGEYIRLSDQSYQGVAVAFLRICVPVSPVSYPAPAPYYSPTIEHRTAPPSRRLMRGAKKKVTRCQYRVNENTQVPLNRLRDGDR